MNDILATLWAALRRWRSRRPVSLPRTAGRRCLTPEPLEARLALAADLTFAPIHEQTVLGGAPLWLGIDGLDAGGGSLTYTVSVSNPELLTASLSPASNSSLQMDVFGYGQMTFQLFDHLTPQTIAHIKSLVESGDFSSDPLLPVKWYRIAHFMDGEDFVIQGGPQYNAGISPLGPFDDEYHLDLQFTSAGLLGMGKANDDTNDAAIFVTAAPSRFLDFNYSIFGVLTEGESVRQAIQRTRASGDGPPPTDIVITSSRIINDTQNAALLLKAAEGASGESDVTLSVTDAAGHVFSQVFHVTVSPDTANSAPFLADIPDTITAESGVPISLQLHAIDAEGDPSFFNAARPGIETVPYSLEVNHDTGLVTISPPAGFTGRFQVQFGVRGVSTTTTADEFDIQLVEFVVGEPGDPGEPNQPPAAEDDAAFAYSAPGTFFINVLANDTTAPDTDESLTIVSVSTPESGGSTTINGSLVVYTPGAGFTGTDHFTYTIGDGHGGTATATVTVTVNAAPTDNPQVGLILQLTTPGGTRLTGLAPGQEFVLHVLIQDQSAPPQGVYAAYLDIEWDAALATVTGPIQYGSIFANGMLGDTFTPGLIDEAGAFAGLPNLGGGIYEVFSVPMRAAAGTLEFTANPADFTPVTDVLVYGSNDAVPAASIHYGTVSIAVGALSPLDVSGDGQITPIDALIVINAINEQFASDIRDGSLPIEDDSSRLDVSRDGLLTAVDALIVINFLNGATTSTTEETASPLIFEAECSPAIGDVYLLALAADDLCLEWTQRAGRLRRV